MPNRATVFRWLGANVEFCDQYARARESQADALFDEILGISDNTQEDADVQRDRLRVDARKWMAGKLRPKAYGEKVDLTHDVADPLAALLNRIDGKSRSLPG